MATVIWSARAKADLAAVGDYFALGLKMPGYSATITRRILQATRHLSTFPLSGRMVPEISDESLREVVYRNYRIVYLYWVEYNQVEVLTVFQSSQQFGAL